MIDLGIIKIFPVKIINFPELKQKYKEFVLISVVDARLRGLPRYDPFKTIPSWFLKTTFKNNCFK